MQRLAAVQALDLLPDHFGTGMARVAVHRIAGQRMARFAHVHADLVGAAGFQRAFDIAVVAVALQHFDVGNGFFAAEFDHRHFQAVVRVAADGGVDFAVKGHDAVGHRAVNTLDAAVLQLLHQMVLRRQGFGHHHQAAGVFVEPVDDAGARHLRERGTMRQQAVEQRARPVARRRMHHQTGRLVEHDHAVVFIHNVQRHRFGGKGQRFFVQLRAHFDFFATDQFVFGRSRLAV